ncbi:MAG TPA: hypothetical protein VK509_22970 [Polyangiales bacterium]|nr:hypothetical protein [Polyangiales bacterium]
MSATLPAALRVIGGLLLLLWGSGCSASEDADSAARGGDWRPWVSGGQTGALTPRCGLSLAAEQGDSIPGGDSGIVIQTDSCVGLSAAELELHDEDGMMIAFDLVTLPNGAVLLKPRNPLPAGVYSLTIAGKPMTPVIAMEPAVLPMRLGTLEPGAPQCGVNLELTLDPLVLEYLPQLKLSVSVDGGLAETWFDYGDLQVNDGRAQLSFDDDFPQRLADGEHSLRVTAELAGESGTLEPIDVIVRIECPAHDSGVDEDADMSAACAAAPSRRTPGMGGFGSFTALLSAVALIVRRSRRSSG